MSEHNISGAKAEDQVADYLIKHGYKILSKNWKTKWCEIDIVAKKDDCIYFVEVKYRGSDSQGGGFEYITSNKLRQMDLAARSWAEINGWEGEHTLSASEVSGPNFKVKFIEDILS